jgi:hypothetical protein
MATPRGVRLRATSVSLTGQQARARVELETDGNGNTNFFPVYEWGVALAPDRTVGLLFDYPASPDDLAMGRRRRVQLYMEADAALAFARSLQGYAEQAKQRPPGKA